MRAMAVGRGLSFDAGCRPAEPAAKVGPEAGGGFGLPRFRLAKPDRTGDESREGFLRQHETLRAEMITEKIEASFDPADEGLVRVRVSAPG